MTQELRAAAIRHDGSCDVDALLAGVTEAQRRRGWRVRGLLMAPAASGGDCLVEMVAGRRRQARFWLPRLAAARARLKTCRADPQGLRAPAWCCAAPPPEGPTGRVQPLPASSRPKAAASRRTAEILARHPLLTVVSHSPGRRLALHRRRGQLLPPRARQSTLARARWPEQPMALHTWLIYLAGGDRPVALAGPQRPAGADARRAAWPAHDTVDHLRRFVRLRRGDCAVDVRHRALLQTSLVWLTVLKWLGGAYLVWLGIQVWRAPALGVELMALSSERGGWSLFRQGALSAMTNPKGHPVLRRLPAAVHRPGAQPRHAVSDHGWHLCRHRGDHRVSHRQHGAPHPPPWLSAAA